jgi:hypothetical protein
MADEHFELVTGDVIHTLPAFLESQPSTIIALALFDLDLYEPTKVSRQLIKPYLTRGSVLVFDQVGYRKWPGETRALAEAIGLNGARLKRFPYSTKQSYLVWE